MIQPVLSALASEKKLVLERQAKFQQLVAFSSVSQLCTEECSPIIP